MVLLLTGKVSNLLMSLKSMVQFSCYQSVVGRPSVIGSSASCSSARSTCAEDCCSYCSADAEAIVDDAIEGVAIWFQVWNGKVADFHCDFQRAKWHIHF